MKKKIFLLLLGFMLIGIGGVKVNAEESVPLIKWKKNDLGLYRTYKSQDENGTINRAKVPDFIITLNDEAIFCAEMLEQLAENFENDNLNGIKAKLIENSNEKFNEYYNPKDGVKKYKYNNKDYDSKELIEVIAYYGRELHKNGKDTTEKEEYYLAAQRLIWEILNEAEIYPRKGLYASERYPEGQDETDLVDGKIYFTKDDKEVSLVDKEKEIMELVENFYTMSLPTSLNLNNIKDFKINDENHKYIEIENKDNELTNFTFDEKSECQFNDDKTKVICTDTNDDNNIQIKLEIIGEKNNFYSVEDKEVEHNQFLLYGKSLPSKSFEHSFKFISEENPVENVVVEKPEKNPTTSDTNIILIVTICLCTLISAIIIYIKKVNLIKNDTI